MDYTMNKDEYMIVEEDKYPYLRLGDYFYYENIETKKVGSGCLKKINLKSRLFQLGPMGKRGIWNRKWDEYTFFMKKTKKNIYNNIFHKENPFYQFISVNSEFVEFQLEKYFTGKLKIPPQVTEIKTKLEKFEFLKQLPGVYVLELEQGYYYIGESDNMYRRIFEHFMKRGAKLTLLYEPTKFLCYYEEENTKERLKLENEITEEYIEKYGAGKVRGGIYI